MYKELHQPDVHSLVEESFEAGLAALGLDSGINLITRHYDLQLFCLLEIQLTSKTD